MNGTPTLSVVVPCYNEEQSLPVLYERVSAVARAVVGDAHEIVLVNDGSSDGTWELMQELVERDVHMVAVDLSRNHGHQLAISAGLSVTRGERIFILDADLQDPPELLGEMMELMDRGADVVYGQRQHRDGERFLRKLAIKVFYRILAFLTEIDIPLDTGDFRLISRRVRDALLAMPEQARFIRGMVSWVGYKQVALTYNRPARYAGTSKYPFHKLVQLALNGITGFSTKPLRLAIHAGFFVGALGLMLLAYFLFCWWKGQINIAGWTSLASLILILGSLQLMFLGIIGEYIGKIFTEVKRRPLFIVRTVLRSSR